MPSVAQVIEGALGRKDSPADKSAVVWTLQGQPDDPAIRRFGDTADFFWFRCLRCIAVIDAIRVPFFLSFVALNAERREWSRSYPVMLACIASTTTYAMGIWHQLSTSVVDLKTATEIVSLKGIFKHRLRSHLFIVDSLSLLEILWIPTGYDTFAILGMLRLWRIMSFADDLYELHHADFESEDTVHGMLVVSCKMLGLIHCIGCAWFATIASHPMWGEREFDADLRDDPRWLGGHLSAVYLICFSDSARMFAGWGWAEPLKGEFSSPERIFHALAAPFSAVGSAYIFAQIIALTTQVSHAAKHLEYLAEIVGQLKTTKCPPSLNTRILKYHTFLSVHNVGKGSSSASEQESSDMGLSIDLQKECRLYEFEALVTTAPFFQDVEAHDVVALVLAFKQQAFAPSEFVIRKGEIGSEMYFVMKGLCNILSDSFQQLATKSFGEYFGEVGLLVDTERTAHVQSSSFSVVEILTREALFKCMAHSPEQLKAMMTSIKGTMPSKVNRRSVMDVAIKHGRGVSLFGEEDAEDLLGGEDTTDNPRTLEVQEEEEEEKTPLLSERSGILSRENTNAPTSMCCGKFDPPTVPTVPQIPACVIA